MKLLYVVNQFPRLSESFVINELHELDKRGHKVAVFSKKQPDEEVPHTEVQDMDITIHYGEKPSLRSLPDLFSRHVVNTTVLRQALFIENPFYHSYCLHLSKQIAEAIEAEDGVDLIHAHFATPHHLAVTYAAAYHDIPCTVTAHAYEIFSPSSLPRLQRVCSRFNHVIVPSNYNQRYLANKIGIDTDISVVPATTSVDKFEPSDGSVQGRLLTVARLIEKKGHEYAIDAVADLIKQGYDVEYHIIGTGERETFLRNRVQKYGVEDQVKFLGSVSDERLLDELHEAMLFILPCVIASNGDRDGSPVALKEAMATQTACISTTISGIPEMITDGYDGILVEPNNSSELSHSIAELLDDPSKRRNIAKNGAETIRTKFDISTAVDELVDVFERVQQKPR